MNGMPTTPDEAWEDQGRSGELRRVLPAAAMRRAKGRRAPFIRCASGAVAVVVAGAVLTQTAGAGPEASSAVQDANSMISTIPATAVSIAFVLWGAFCVLLLLAGLPGAWILIASAIAIDSLEWLWRDPAAPLTFHPLTIAACVLLASIGELLEFLLSAAGAKRFGGSAAGMWGSVIGGMLGAILGTFLLLPILGTLIGAAVGTAGGAIVGEMCAAKKSFEDSMKPALGAVIGRLLGTLAKLPVALAVWVILSFAAFL